MTSFGNKTILRDEQQLGQTLSSGDVARILPDTAIVGWSYPGSWAYFQAVQMVTRQVGPRLTIYEEMGVLGIAEGNAGEVWVLADNSAETHFRVGLITISAETLELTIAWVTTAIERANSGNDGWIFYWPQEQRLVVGSNCGDPNDLDGVLISQYYMLTRDGTLIDQTSSPVDDYGYARWIETPVLNPYLNQLMSVHFVHEYDRAEYGQTVTWTTPISADGFGGQDLETWTQRNTLIDQFPSWVTGAGTPGGWHFLLWPSYWGGADVVVLDANTKQRLWTTLSSGNVSSFFDYQYAKVYDVHYDSDTNRVAYSALNWDRGLLLGLGDADSSSLPIAHYIPRTEDVVWDALMRVTSIGPNKYAYLGGVSGLEKPYAGLDQLGRQRPASQYRIALWLAADLDPFAEAQLFPDADGQTEDRRTFRRVP